uniref:Cyclic nucleotide-binding domain-containing protein n=1 Tax=Alexandrium catenella TaxID=2925 RepID=A0A7S1LSD2_ALECA|mmetsp:Transcript_12811/g.35148  ORF Transcript_12811/g.35148 Transcript_12811/m.35148 type:complete len:368 (+) Transcript_12811:2-1105(+)
MGDILSLCCQTGHSKDEKPTSSHMGNTEATPVGSKISRDDEVADVMDDARDKQRMDQIKGGQRRKGVAAESVATMDVRDYKKPVYPKDTSASNKIRDVLREDQKMQVLFGHLDQTSIMDIVNAFKERTARKGETLIQQGDQGDCLYIIDDGEVDIFVARPGPDGKVTSSDRGSKVVALGVGKLFGELALLYSAPRAATAVVASGSCRLWQLDREPFKMLLAQKSVMQSELYEGWLSEVDILKSLNRYELSRLSDLLQSELYDTGEEIVNQGEGGDKFYILEDGTAAAYIAGTDGEKEVKVYDTQGQYFGEIALLRDEPRKATVRATGEGCSVLSMSKEDFTSVLGPIQDILRKHIDKYPQYAHFLKG